MLTEPQVRFLLFHRDGYSFAPVERFVIEEFRRLVPWLTHVASGARLAELGPEANVQGEVQMMNLARAALPHLVGVV